MNESAQVEQKCEKISPCVVKNISAAYRDRLALSKVSFTVPNGEIMAILGPNGAGKSTLIKAMLELIPRVSGEVEFFGENISKVPSIHTNRTQEYFLAHIILHQGRDQK